MADRTPDRTRSSFLSIKTTLKLMITAAAAIGLWFGSPTASSFAQGENAGSTEPEEEPAEWLAKPEELASIPINRIIKSLRLNAIAMKLGREIYENECASCHGDDLRYGIRSHHPYTRGTEGAMLAFNPQYRTTDDTKDYGTDEYHNAAEIDDVAEYVLQLGDQKFDVAKAARGKALFFNNAKGNCFDCHGEDGTGNDTIGSTNLTKTRLYLYGSDRASIVESITKGRHGFMPAFDDKLKPEEIKAVSVYVFLTRGGRPRAAGPRRDHAEQ